MNCSCPQVRLLREYRPNLIETLLFYHPAIWMIFSNDPKERETCCDDAAIAVASSKIVYVSALAALEEARALPGEAALALTRSLLKRVQRVFGAGNQDRPLLLNVIRESYKGMALGVICSDYSAGLFCHPSRLPSLE